MRSEDAWWPIPGYVDENLQFVDADFRCEACGAVVNVRFHPSLLADLTKVQRWLDKTAPCACKNRPA